MREDRVRFHLVWLHGCSQLSSLTPNRLGTASGCHTATAILKGGWPPSETPHDPLFVTAPQFILFYSLYQREDTHTIDASVPLRTRVITGAIHPSEYSLRTQLIAPHIHPEYWSGVGGCLCHSPTDLPHLFSGDASSTNGPVVLSRFASELHQSSSL